MWACLGRHRLRAPCPPKCSQARWRYVAGVASGSLGAERTPALFYSLQGTMGVRPIWLRTPVLRAFRSARNFDQFCVESGNSPLSNVFVHFPFFISTDGVIRIVMGNRIASAQECGTDPSPVTGPSDLQFGAVGTRLCACTHLERTDECRELRERQWHGQRGTLSASRQRARRSR